MKQLVAFDLDGTLAASKQPLEPAMAQALAGLLGVAKVAVISGGDWPQFDKQVVSRLPDGTDLSGLFILPTTGTKLYRHEGGEWRRVYADEFDAGTRDKIVAALHDTAKSLGFDKEKTWGQQVEDRGSQITFSALGQEAPLDAKTGWDPDVAKRKKMQAALQEKLPDLSIKVGGSTSIDITKQGVDKASGMERLRDASGIPFEAMLFMGDALYPGGNDEPVRRTGIDCIQVRDPQETATVIAAIVACLR